MKLRWLITFAVLLTVVWSTAPSATAARGRHCAIQLVPVSREGARITARAELIGCFPTLAEALAAGSHGTITIDESTTPERRPRLP
jgi:hypothetical protein